MFVGGFEENRAAGSKSAVLISIADPRGAWTDADLDFDQLLTTARPPGADPGLVSFRPPIGKNDQPWPGPSPTASISDDPRFGQDRSGCGHCLAAPPDHGITHLGADIKTRLTLTSVLSPPRAADMELVAPGRSGGAFVAAASGRYSWRFGRAAGASDGDVRDRVVRGDLPQGVADRDHLAADRPCGDLQPPVQAAVRLGV